MNIILFFASIDTLGISEAFTVTSTGGDPEMKLHMASFIMIILIIMKFLNLKEKPNPPS